MALNYRLIKFSDLTISRGSQGHYVDGDWVAGDVTTFTIKAKVQPLKDTELLLLTEASRNRAWVKVYIQEGLADGYPELRAAQQGPQGFDPDTFLWQGYKYEVMKDLNYNDSTLDHTRVFAARVEVTPN
jgi:hypothetical protein